MKKIKNILAILVAVAMVTIVINGCATSQSVAAKSGSQLWGENCVRCHNAPSSADYSGVQWETIGMHMKLRACLTEVETKKIIDFLQSGN